MTEQLSNRVDQLANDLHRQGRVDELELELKKLSPDSLETHEQETWWHFYGITAFQGGRDQDALERFKEALKRFPESGQIRFSLGQQYLRTGDTEKAFKLFRNSLFPEISSAFALAEARYAYLWSRYDDGLTFIRPIFDAYKQVKILDDHFLYIRELPFFSRWWQHMAVFSVLSGDFQELETLTSLAMSTCCDYDFEHLQTELNAYRKYDPELLIPALEDQLRNLSKSNFPSGHTRMSIAVAKSRATTNLQAAEAFLSQIVVAEHDFAWLEDIRTLAMAEAADRFGDTEQENNLIENFLQRQPLLFEPDIALRFHLLKYQEKLKPRVTEQYLLATSPT